MATPNHHPPIWLCQQIRNTWRYYYEGTEALIFVVDSQDKSRVEEGISHLCLSASLLLKVSHSFSTSKIAAKNELHKVLSQSQLKDATLLVIANKQDTPDHLSA